MPWFKNLETGLEWYISDPEHAKLLRKNKETYEELEKPAKKEEASANKKKRSAK